MEHTLVLRRDALGGGVGLGVPRLAEKHWGDGGFVRICNNLSSSLPLMVFIFNAIGVFSKSPFILHKQI